MRSRIRSRASAIALSALSLVGVCNSAPAFNLFARLQGPQKTTTKTPPKIMVCQPTSARPLFITESYIRMKHPEVIVRLASSVQAGKASVADLNALVGEDLAKGLVGANLKPLQDKVKSNGKNGPGIVDYAVVVNTNGPVATLPGSAYSPHKLDHSDVRVDQTVTSVLEFTSLYAGPVTAKFDNDFGGGATITYLANYTGTQAPDSSGNLQPVVNQYVSNGGPLTAVAGQDFRVYTHFKFPKAGTYKTNLVVTGSGQLPWSLSVPVEIKVLEMGNSTAIGYADIPQLNVDSLGDTYQLPVTVETVKFKGPFSVTVTPKNVPAGFHVDPVSLNITKAGKVSAQVKVKGSSSVMGQKQNIEFEVAAGDSDKTSFKATVMCLKGRVEYTFPDQTSGDTTWSKGFVDLAADGSFFIGGTLTQGGILPYTAYIGVFYGQSLVSNIGYVMYVDVSMYGNSTSTNSGHSNWIVSHWPNCLISAPGTLIFEDDNQAVVCTNTGNTITSAKFPSSPPFTVTSW